MNKKVNKKIILKAITYFLEFVALILFLYLLILPFYPEFKYRFEGKKEVKSITEEQMTLPELENKVKVAINYLPQAEFDVSSQRLIIEKIGVNIPIVESASSEYGLHFGAWRDPKTSTPDKGGNTVITGHRFKYLPPSNLTFYLFHKLEIGDIASILWNDEYFIYKIKEIKTVEPTEISILEATDDSILTMYTCDPIYSQDKRLVVIAELIE